MPYRQQEPTATTETATPAPEREPIETPIAAHPAPTTANPADQANALQQATGGHLARGGATLLQLQRQYGNRYVQQVVTHAQSTDGARRGRGAPIVQAKLAINPPGDTYEQEADRVAEQVSALPATPGSTPGQAMDDDENDELVQTKAAPTRGNVPASPGLEQAIQGARGGGQPLGDSTRAAMEQQIGADFGGVRLHTDARADQMNQSIQAKAFTTGQDIFFRKGAYNAGSPDGQRLLAHELAHVVQQGGNRLYRSQETRPVGEDDELVTPMRQPHISSAQTDLIQRDIGFEFETKDMQTMSTNIMLLPSGGRKFADEQSANKTVLNDATKPLDKGEVLFRHNSLDMEIQADDDGSFSDLEVVTTNFPLNDHGRERLKEAMEAVNEFARKQCSLGKEAGKIVPAQALDEAAKFRTAMHNGILAGDMTTATTSPQTTFGIRLDNVPDIVRDLHGDPDENEAQAAARSAGRLHILKPENEGGDMPRDLFSEEESEDNAQNTQNEAKTLINARTLAREAIGNYQRKHQQAPGGPNLEGLLTIIFVYSQGAKYKTGFLKSHTPLLAKTDLATVFTTLLPEVQAYYSRRDWRGKTNLEELVASAPGYKHKMDRPLFQDTTKLADNDTRPGKQRQWYHNLTLRRWVRNLVWRKRRGIVSGIKTVRPGRDLLTDQTFPGKPQDQKIEGYGALGQKTDTDFERKVLLPVFELRTASRRISYEQAQRWALNMFDYIKSLNDDPGGKHKLIKDNLNQEQ